MLNTLFTKHETTIKEMKKLLMADVVATLQQKNTDPLLILTPPEVDKNGEVRVGTYNGSTIYAFISNHCLTFMSPTLRFTNYYVDTYRQNNSPYEIKSYDRGRKRKELRLGIYQGFSQTPEQILQGITKFMKSYAKAYKYYTNQAEKQRATAEARLAQLNATV